MSRRRMNISFSKKLGLVLLPALLLLVVSGYASTFRSGENIHISNLHNIDDDFYASGNTVRIDGTITGDVCVASYNAIINGQIGGSANLAGRTADHSGRVEGALRFAGERLTLNGYVGRSVIAFGSMIEMGQGAVVEKDVSVSGGEIRIDGIIKGDVECKSSRTHITARIDGDVLVKGDGKTIVSPPAVISGNITYISVDEEALELEQGVTVKGEVIWKKPEAAAKEDTNYLADITFRFASLFAAFLFGIIALKLFRPYAEESFSQLRKRLSVSLAAGLLGLLVLAFCILILMASLVAMLIGTVLLGGDYAVMGILILVFSILMVPISSFISVSGGIILYSGKIVVALLVGYLIVRLWKPQTKTLTKSAMLLGLLVLTIAFYIPYVGSVLFFLTTITGAGAIILGIRHCRKKVETLASSDLDAPAPTDLPQ